MAEAGYENGFDITCTVTSSYLIHVNTAVELASELKAIGINMEIKQVDWATWLDEVYAGRHYDTTVICLTSAYAPFDVVGRYASTSDGNFINYSNSEVDKLMAQIPLTADNDERTELYHQVLGLLTADACSVYLQDPTTITAVSTRLEGYHVYPMYVQDMSQVKLVGN
jgi:peptide/nickel transport system substrate-binding protein